MDAVSALKEEIQTLKTTIFNLQDRITKQEEAYDNRKGVVNTYCSV